MRWLISARGDLLVAHQLGIVGWAMPIKGPARSWRGVVLPLRCLTLVGPLGRWVGASVPCHAWCGLVWSRWVQCNVKCCWGNVKCGFCSEVDRVHWMWYCIMWYIRFPVLYAVVTLSNDFLVWFPFAIWYLFVYRSCEATTLSHHPWQCHLQRINLQWALPKACWKHQSQCLQLTKGETSPHLPIHM